MQLRPRVATRIDGTVITHGAEPVPDNVAHQLPDVVARQPKRRVVLAVVAHAARPTVVTKGICKRRELQQLPTVVHAGAVVAAGWQRGHATDAARARDVASPHLLHRSNRGVCAKECLFLHVSSSREARQRRSRHSTTHYTTHRLRANLPREKSVSSRELPWTSCWRCPLRRCRRT